MKETGQLGYIASLPMLFAGWIEGEVPGDSQVKKFLDSSSLKSQEVFQITFIDPVVQGPRL